MVMEYKVHKCHTLPMLQVPKTFKGHKFVIWFGSPRIDLDGVFKSDHEELDALILHYTEMNGAL